MIHAKVLMRIYHLAVFLAVVAVLFAIASRSEAAPHGRSELHAHPAQLVIQGLKRHRHKSVGKCLDHGKWIRGCR